MCEFCSPEQLKSKLCKLYTCGYVFAFFHFWRFSCRKLYEKKQQAQTGCDYVSTYHVSYVKNMTIVCYHRLISFYSFFFYSSTILKTFCFELFFCSRKKEDLLEVYYFAFGSKWRILYIWKWALSMSFI